MSNFPRFTADHHGFYCDDRPFIPLIQDHSLPLKNWSNVVYLRLPAGLNDDLSWRREKEQALQIVSSGKHLLWELDLGLSSFKFTPENSAAFFSFSLAIEEFTTQFWPGFQKQTFGIVLYQGLPPSEKNFPLADWEPSFLDWSHGLGLDPGGSSYELYRIQMLNEYLHRLISFLPDSVLPFAVIDASLISSPGKIAQFFSKDRFEHVQLALKGANCPFSGICWDDGQHGQGYLGSAMNCKIFYSSPTAGLYLPQDTFMNAFLIEELDKVILELNNNQTAFRIIPEGKLTEQWDGIDRLFVPSQAISGQGRRKLLGFVAAGGSILAFDGTELREHLLISS
jgi:hypothetical protein